MQVLSPESVVFWILFFPFGFPGNEFNPNLSNLTLVWRLISLNWIDFPFISVIGIQNHFFASQFFYQTFCFSIVLAIISLILISPIYLNFYR